MAVEVLRAQRALITFLRTDTILASIFTGFGLFAVPVYADYAPREVVPPYIITTTQSAEDTNAIGAERAFVNPTFQITCISKEGGYEQIAPVADRVDNLLTSTDAIIVDGVYVTRLVRSGVLIYTDDIDNIRYYSIGQIYSNIAYAYSP